MDSHMKPENWELVLEQATKVNTVFSNKSIQRKLIQDAVTTSPFPLL